MMQYCYDKILTSLGSLGGVLKNLDHSNCILDPYTGDIAWVGYAYFLLPS